MYLNTDADIVDPAKILMAKDGAHSPDGTSYANSNWAPVTSGPTFWSCSPDLHVCRRQHRMACVSSYTH